MLIERLESEQKQMAFQASGEREREHRASEGLLHERQEFDPEKESVDGFRQNEKDITPEERMHEIYQMENAYGRITLGMNEKGETVLSTQRRKYVDGPTMNNNEKEVNQADAYRWIGRGGEKELNKKDPADSAYALYSRDREGDVARMQGDTLMKESERFGEKTGQHALQTMLPTRTGDAKEDREAYALHQKLARRMEMAMLENRSKIKNKEESARRKASLPTVEKETSSPDKPDEEEDDSK